MDTTFENYLVALEKELVTMPAPEKGDALGEIKSRIEEQLFLGGASNEEILSLLGSPQELSAYYLGRAIERTHGISLGKLKMVVALYQKKGASQIITLLLLGMLAIAFFIAGIAIPFAGLISTSGYLFKGGNAVSTIDFIGVTVHPSLLFPITLIIGLFLILAGVACWRAIKKYILSSNLEKESPLTR